MSIAAIAWAKKQKCGSGTAKAVLMAVADYADEHGRAWPSQKTISDDTEFTDRSVRTALQALEERGLIRREERRRPDGSRAPDMITLFLSSRATAPPSQAEAPSGGGERASGGYRKELPGGGEGASGLTTFEPPPEPEVVVEEARARAPTIADADALVAVVAEILPEFHPLLGDVLARSVALGWLRSGYDPQLDVLPAVARALEGEFAIKRWKGLTGWVENAHRDRLEVEQARAPPEIIPPTSAAPRPRQRSRDEPLSIVDIGRIVAANPPPGYS